MRDYGIALYPHGVVSHVDGRKRKKERLGNHVFVTLEPLFGKNRPPRGEIRGFTEGSRRNLRWLLVNALVEFAVHATLTYHAHVDEGDGEAVAARNRALVKRAKQDLNRLLTNLRSEAGAYVWTQEFQGRGAIHFHVLFEREVAERRLAVAWCRATGQLDDPHALKHSVRVAAVEDQRAARRYLIKYFGKEVQKRLPAGVERAGRFWSSSRSLSAEPVMMVVTAQAGARKHERAALAVDRSFRKYVARLLGFNRPWRGGRLVFWDDQRVLQLGAALRQLRAFFRDHGFIVAMLERHGWEAVAPEVAAKQERFERSHAKQAWAQWV